MRSACNWLQPGDVLLPLDARPIQTGGWLETLLDHRSSLEATRRAELAAVAAIGTLSYDACALGWTCVACGWPEGSNRKNEIYNFRAVPELQIGKEVDSL